jgi:DNA-binding winged helix-turn-helix (wHTH) protein
LQVNYGFSTFEIDGESSELRRSGRLVCLQPHPAHALAFLLWRAGEIVPRDERDLDKSDCWFEHAD